MFELHEDLHNLLRGLQEAVQLEVQALDVDGVDQAVVPEAELVVASRGTDVWLVWQQYTIHSAFNSVLLHTQQHAC